MLWSIKRLEIITHLKWISQRHCYYAIAFLSIFKRFSYCKYSKMSLVVFVQYVKIWRYMSYQRSHGMCFRIIGPLWGEFTSHQWILSTKITRNVELFDKRLYSLMEIVVWTKSWVAGNLGRHDAHVTSQWFMSTLLPEAGILGRDKWLYPTVNCGM